MTQGMVAWAGGGTGPDFFIYTGAGPNTWWAHDHTVFAEVHDEDWPAVEALAALPTDASSGMKMLRRECEVTLRMVHMAHNK